MQRISMLGFRDRLAFPVGIELNAPIVLEKNNTAMFIDRLRGRSTVLVISHPAGAEAIELYSPDGLRLMAIARGVDESPIMMHPTGACVEFQGLPSTACDYVASICNSVDAITSLQRCLTQQDE